MLDSTIDAPQLSISDPRYNIREIVKQMILLEQHLLEKNKYCPDCISKHILTIEALAEEGQCLDAQRRWCKLLHPLVGKARVWGAAFEAQVPPHKIGQDVRAVRKQLAPRLVSVTSPKELGAVDFGALELAEELTERPSRPWMMLGLVAAGAALVLYQKKEL